MSSLHHPPFESFQRNKIIQFIMDAQILIEDLNEILLNDSFNFIEVLGQGSFGLVVSAYSSYLDRVVAIKITSQVDQENEANLLQDCHHPNIVKLHRVLAANNHLYLIMERLEGQTLDKVMQKGTLSEDEIRNIMTQILNALVYIHRKGIIHRDLKPENIFVCDNNYVKLIDLGLGQKIICRGLRLKQVGTPYFVAPEVINAQEYNQLVDIFSLGIIFYMMLNNGTHPLWKQHMKKKDYYALISTEFELEFSPSMPEMAKDFITNTIQLLPENRMTAQQCLEHPWSRGEQRKSHPQTQREIQMAFSGCQKILKLIKTTMLLCAIKEACPPLLRLLKTEYSPEEDNQIFEPQTARNSIKPSRKLVKRKATQEQFLFSKPLSQREFENEKNKILIQRRYQMMLSKIKEKAIQQKLDQLMTTNTDHFRRGPHTHSLPQVSYLHRQQSLRLGNSKKFNS